MRLSWLVARWSAARWSAARWFAECWFAARWFVARWFAACWLVLLCAAAIGACPTGGAVAQGLLAPTRQYGQPQVYQTPGYRPPTPSSLDKNYGLPSFGLPGSELPKQKTMAPERKADAPTVPDFIPQAPQQTIPQAPQQVMAPDRKPDEPPVPDFFAAAPEIALPKVRTEGATAAGMDTPLFTTSDGSAIDDTDTSTGDTMTPARAANAADGSTVR